MTLSLPDDRYMRTLDPWVSLSSIGGTRIRLATAVALPVEHASDHAGESIATLDTVARRVSVGVVARLEHRRACSIMVCHPTPPHHAARIPSEAAHENEPRLTA